jgi:hypothetical protein
MGSCELLANHDAAVPDVCHAAAAEMRRGEMQLIANRLVFTAFQAS